MGDKMNIIKYNPDLNELRYLRWWIIFDLLIYNISRSVQMSRKFQMLIKIRNSLWFSDFFSDSKLNWDDVLEGNTTNAQPNR
jgi:hypothetical protein